MVWTREDIARIHDEMNDGCSSMGVLPTTSDVDALSKKVALSAAEVEDIEDRIAELRDLRRSAPVSDRVGIEERLLMICEATAPKITEHYDNLRLLREMSAVVSDINGPLHR